MFPDLPWFVWLFLGVFAFFMIMEAINAPRRKRERAARLEKLQRDAAGRGWTVESERGANFSILSFSGTTDGVTWRLAARARTYRGGVSSSSRSRARSVWSSDDARLGEGELIAIWPGFGKPEVAAHAGAGSQMLADLLVTPLISALGAERVDRQLFTSAAPYPADQSLVGHYLLRATDSRLMESFLSAGALTALKEVAPWLPTRQPNHLIVAVISAGGVTMLLEGWIEDIELVTRLARFGAAVTNAARSTTRSFQST